MKLGDSITFRCSFVSTRHNCHCLRLRISSSDNLCLSLPATHLFDTYNSKSNSTHNACCKGQWCRGRFPHWHRFLSIRFSSTTSIDACPANANKGRSLSLKSKVLVCTRFARSGVKSSLGRSFGLKAIEPLFRYTRKRVCKQYIIHTLIADEQCSWCFGRRSCFENWQTAVRRTRPWPDGDNLRWHPTIPRKHCRNDWQHLHSPRHCIASPQSREEMGFYSYHEGG